MSRRLRRIGKNSKRRYKDAYLAALPAIEKEMRDRGTVGLESETIMEHVHTYSDIPDTKGNWNKIKEISLDTHKPLDMILDLSHGLRWVWAPIGGPPVGVWHHAAYVLGGFATYAMRLLFSLSDSVESIDEYVLEMAQQMRARGMDDDTVAKSLYVVPCLSRYDLKNGDWSEADRKTLLAAVADIERAIDYVTGVSAVDVYEGITMIPERV